MHHVEYRALKAKAINDLGAQDAETLEYYADVAAKKLKPIKYFSIVAIVLGLPAVIVFFGIPMILVGLYTYFRVYRKGMKSLEGFREHLKHDKDLDPVPASARGAMPVTSG